MRNSCPDGDFVAHKFREGQNLCWKIWWFFLKLPGKFLMEIPASKFFHWNLSRTKFPFVGGWSGRYEPKKKKKTQRGGQWTTNLCWLTCKCVVECKNKLCHEWVGGSWGRPWPTHTSKSFASVWNIPRAEGQSRKIPALRCHEARAHSAEGYHNKNGGPRSKINYKWG